MFMRTYTSSRVKRKSFHRKSELKTGVFVDFRLPYWCTKWRLHTKLYEGAWNVSANNSETVGQKDLRLGQIVYILVFHNISFSWLLPLDGFQFTFCCVTVKTIYWETKRNDPLVRTLFWKKKFKDFSRTHPIFQGPHSVRKRALSPCLF